jgi:hypothetical protein
MSDSERSKLEFLVGYLATKGVSVALLQEALKEAGITAAAQSASSERAERVRAILSEPVEHDTDGDCATCEVVERVSAPSELGRCHEPHWSAPSVGLPDSVIDRVLEAWPKAFGAISTSLSIEQLRAVQEMDQAVTKLGLRHEQRKAGTDE